MTDVQDDGEVDILGDAILVLNRDLQVEWFWDAFSHLEVHARPFWARPACSGRGGCADLSQAPIANDWLHGNLCNSRPMAICSIRRDIRTG